MMKRQGVEPPGRTRAVLLAVLCLGLLWAVPAYSAYRLSAEAMQRIVRPWPPQGWAVTLALPQGEQAVPHESKLILRDGYFGQTLFRHIAGTPQHWTANVLVQDRGSPSAAWHAVSAVRCSSRLHLGFRARECERNSGLQVTKTLHYQVGRFYVTIQVAGPGEMAYPVFEVGGMPGKEVRGAARRARSQRGSMR